MTDQEKQKLNRKLAGWVFPNADKIKMTDECICAIHQDIGTFVYGLFTDSLDACVEWLVPKLDYFCLQKEEDGRGFYADVSVGEQYKEYYQGETLALALCLAIEKLIE